MGKLKHLTIVAGSKYTQDVLFNQLSEYLDSSIEVTKYTIDEKRPKFQESVVVFSSKESYLEFLDIEGKDLLKNYIIGKRMVSYEHLDKVMMLPKGEKILFVNDSKESAEESISNIKSIGIDYLNLVPYYPGCTEDIENIKIGITPGEIDKMPKTIEKVYDIGVRILDFSTVVKLLKELDILDERVQRFVEGYSTKIVELSKKIMELSEQNKASESFFRQNIIGKGYYAKYTFEDILGVSEKIKNAKAIASKLAKTNLTILIEGESGTGKELFASSIHNASDRKKAPFLAVNFSAISDELLESELFGYEEGSFTGAKKGGKVGLFEQANGGTIFLDEIGDISPKMQVKLLRVIQEKEIMRVGADRIIPVDVRVIAATNKNLRDMIDNGTFREDLYYRLKMGYIGIPSLRDRKNDIELIIKNILENEADNKKKISKDAIDILKEYNWPGNVRELINTALYMIAMSEREVIDASNLPDDRFFGDKAPLRKTDEQNSTKLKIKEEKILTAINCIKKKGKLAGREKIINMLKDDGFDLTQYQVRKHITELEKKGMIYKENGSYGLVLTKIGIEYLERLSEK